MARCSCGAELSTTSLRCGSCGRKLTLDVTQAGDYQNANRIDWDREFERLTSGDLPTARTESVVRRPGFWRRLFGR